MGKSEFLADIDHLDVTPRGEGMNCPGNPVMLQLGFLPAYALTVFLTGQALSDIHCLLRV